MMMSDAGGSADLSEDFVPGRSRWLLWISGAQLGPGVNLDRGVGRLFQL